MYRSQHKAVGEAVLLVRQEQHPTHAGLDYGGVRNGGCVCAGASNLLVYVCEWVCVCFYVHVLLN